MVVDYNMSGGSVYLGAIARVNAVHTQEVVVRSNDGVIDLFNRVKSVEVQNNNMLLIIHGDVDEHIDLKNNSRNSYYYMISNTCPDLWIENQCGNFAADNKVCGWEDYINDC